MKRIIPMILAVLILLAGCSSTPDLTEPEKVAVQFWEASYYHYDKQKLDSLLSSNSVDDTEIYRHFKPTKPGKAWITSKPLGDQCEVFIYFSPELHQGGGLLKQLTLVNEGGKWRVYESKGIKGTNNLDFKSFQGTPQYRELFGDIEWKEVEMK